MTNTPSLRLALGIGITASVLALVKVAWFPMSVPMPAGVPARLVDQLKAQGWRQEAAPASRRGTDLSRAQGVQLSQAQAGGTPGLKLSVVPVRVRNHEDFTIQAISKALGQPLAKTTTNRTLSGDQLLLSREANGMPSLHTCIHNGQARVNPADLQRMATEPLQWLDALQLGAGLRQFKTWNCAYVRLQLNTTTASENQLEEIWRQIGPELRRALRQ